jgi:ribonuclease HI
MHNGKIILFTDGGARGNPGPAGAGAYIVDDDGREIGKVSKFLGVRTNNWAEYEAVIAGLQSIKQRFGAKTKEMHVLIKMDSELVMRQLMGVYQVKEETLFPQFIKVWNMRVKDFPHISFEHIPREKNGEADRLANDAMDKGE